MGGLEFWGKRGSKAFDEPRLRVRLARQFPDLRAREPFVPPPAGDDRHPTRASGIQVLEFPRWFVCQTPGCRAHGASMSLVWTGPEGRSGWAQPTGAVVRDLFTQAQASVLVAGYSFDHGASILEPLHAAMKARGVAASLFLHVERAPRRTEDLEAWARGQLATFLAKNWPFGPPLPQLFYDPRTVIPTSVESLHAKCIVVDERVALIGSANFTDRGQTRNVEVGAVIEDEAFARALASQWRSAAAAGAFVGMDFAGG